MITLTEIASNKLKEIIEAEGIEHNSVRVKVLGGGCAGFTHDMTFDDQVGDMDEIIEIDGIKIIVDMISLSYIEGVEIDYVDSPIGAGFKFINPNVKGTCGCGSSVSF
jgi:iron-sulfur cluster insertion protein